MAVVSVNPKQEGEKATLELNNNQSSSPPLYAVTSVYDVKVDTYSQSTIMDVLTATGIPALGSPIATGSNIKAKSVTAERDTNNAFLYRVQVNYGTSPTMTGIWNLELSVDGVEWTQDAYFDKDNNALVNSAGQPFDPTIPKIWYDEEIHVSFDSNTVDADDIAAARGCVNAAEITMTVNGISRTFPIRALKMTTANYKIIWENGAYHWHLDYVLKYRSDTFINKVVDQGYYTKDGSGNLTLIKDQYGDPLPQPSLLNGSGGLGSGTPTYLTFKVEDEYDFSGLLDGFA